VSCRHCGSPLDLQLIDLGVAPPSNAYLTEDQVTRPERLLPLRVLVCEWCWLVQTEDYVDSRDLFDADYAYYSSYSSSWLTHSERLVSEVIARFGLGPDSRVVEVASNDGYLLQYFQARGIPCLGVEPTAGTAAAARARGIRTIETFFGREVGARLATEESPADLTVALNVLAHVPDINDFAEGFDALLAPSGVAVFEFPHLLRLIDGKQFDTIYHEHYSYLSLTSVQRILRSAGLRVFDVEELPTHGGSIRVFACHHGSEHQGSARLEELQDREKRVGIETAEYYAGLQAEAEACRDGFLRFLTELHDRGMAVAAYGAAAKGNTLLNFARIGPDLIIAVADANPAKQGKYLPGSHIPIVSESRLAALRPDYVVVLPWNLQTEIITQLAYLRDHGTRFVTAVPRVQVH
jgi:SAM-dependent methyltransferase